MKKLVSLAVMIFIHTMVFGDALSQCRSLFKKANNESAAQNYAKALEYLVQAETIAENNNLLTMQMRILTNMGVIYYNILDYEKAIECYMKAYQMAIKDPHKYKIEEISILINVSLIYSTNKDYAKAKEYLRIAYKDAIQLQDSKRIVAAAVNLASFANQTGDLEEAEKYLNIAMKMVSPQDSLSLLTAKGVKMENLFLKKEYNKAEQLALVLINQNLSASNNDFKVETLLKLSQIYQQKREFQKAITVAKEALDNSPNLSYAVEIYEQLSKLYLEINAPYLSNQYLHSMIVAKDSLTKITDRNNVMINQVKFDLINSENDLAESRAKQKQDLTFFLFTMAFIILFALIVVGIFYMKSTKNKQLKLFAELELEKQMNEKLVLEKELKDEIFTKNKQLAAKVLFQTSRNELIQEIIDTLKKMPNYQEEPILRSVINKLKGQIKESAEEDSYLVYFEQINPSFLSALKEKHPDLTANEIRLLSFWYLNFDTTEIAKLFNITTFYCRKKKERLAKKMNVSTASMYSYLTNIE